MSTTPSMPSVTGPTDGIIMPELRPTEMSEHYDYATEIDDYSNLDDLGRSIAKARLSLFSLDEQMKEAERMERQAKAAYDRAFRREYLISTEKTDAAKRARAALVCEEIENDWITYELLKSEIKRMSDSVNAELQTLMGIGNNLRQQLKF